MNLIVVNFIKQFSVAAAEWSWDFNTIIEDFFAYFKCYWVFSNNGTRYAADLQLVVVVVDELRAQFQNIQLMYITWDTKNINNNGRES